MRRSLGFDSTALGRSLAYSLYLPDGWSADGPPVPAIYLLHGHGGGENDYLNAAELEAIADRLIAEGALPPVLIVMPDGGNSWYVDAPRFRRRGGGRDPRRSALPCRSPLERPAGPRRAGDRRPLDGRVSARCGSPSSTPDRYAAVAAMSPAVVRPRHLRRAAEPDADRQCSPGPSAPRSTPPGWSGKAHSPRSTPWPASRGGGGAPPAAGLPHCRGRRLVRPRNRDMALAIAMKGARPAGGDPRARRRPYLAVLAAATAGGAAVSRADGLAR